MTLRVLFSMAMAKRESLRTHAIDIAETVALKFDAKAKVDYENFVKTGSMKKPQPVVMTYPPLVRAAIDRIRDNGGRFILEQN